MRNAGDWKDECEGNTKKEKEEKVQKKATARKSGIKERYDKVVSSDGTEMWRRQA